MATTRKALRKQAKRNIRKQSFNETDKNKTLVSKIALGEELNKSEEKRRRIYNEIYSLMQQGYSRRATVGVIQQKYEYKYIEQVYAIVKEAEQFFGEFIEIDTVAARNMVADAYMEMFQEEKEKAEKEQRDPDRDLQIKLLKEYSEVLGLKNLAEKPKPQPLPVINIINNPEVLHNNHSLEAEFELMEDEQNNNSSEA